MMALLDDFMVRAALAGVGVVLTAAPLGCFVLWRRMAYFGDATAHAAILGVALALSLNLPITLGTVISALAMAFTVDVLTRRGLSTDASLGVLSHAALAFGLVAISMIPTVRVDISSLLFGDILAVGHWDLVTIWGGALVITGALIWRWQNLLTVTLHPDLATASGLSPKREQLLLTAGLALVVAVALKVVGALLITALLIIPAAAARAWAKAPEHMVFLAIAIGCSSALGGLWTSYIMDTPTGPTIVSVAALLFAASSIAQSLSNR